MYLNENEFESLPAVGLCENDKVSLTEHLSSDLSLAKLIHKSTHLGIQITLNLEILP